MGSLNQGHKPEGHGREQIMAIASRGEKPYPFSLKFLWKKHFFLF